MITQAYAHEMNRCNRWQNSQLSELFQALTPEELTRDRGAFFGSILGTANHLLWGDWIWMSRFDSGEAPPEIARRPGGMHHSVDLCTDLAAWLRLRETLDARIARWVETLDDDVLAGSLSWYSGVTQAEMTLPYAKCVVHFFNHQTHHRGQLHKMLTETGSQAPVSDLVFMPQEV